MIICLCSPTTDRQIESLIRDGASSVDEIGARCGAGTGCGACRCEIERRLDRAQAAGDCPGQAASVPLPDAAPRRAA